MSNLGTVAVALISWIAFNTLGKPLLRFFDLRTEVRQGRGDDAPRVLQPVYDRFTEGFDTPDLRAAKRLLDELKEDCLAVQLESRPARGS